MVNIEKASYKLAGIIAATLKSNENEESIIKYGAVIFFQTMWCILLKIVFGIIFGVLKEVLIIAFSISLLRKYSGGIHASTPGRCAFTGTAISIVQAISVKYMYMHINSIGITLIAVISVLTAVIIVFKLAPVDSPAKPIKGDKKRKRLKRLSVASIGLLTSVQAILYVLYMTSKNAALINFILCICIGILWQSFTLTSIGHKILGKLEYVFDKIQRH